MSTSLLNSAAKWTGIAYAGILRQHHAQLQSHSSPWSEDAGSDGPGPLLRLGLEGLLLPEFFRTNA